MFRNKNIIKKLMFFFIVIALIPLLLNFQVGGEYANQDACGNEYLLDADNDVHGYVNGMINWGGHSRRFIYGNSSFWPKDLVDCTVTGGLDCSYGDMPTSLYLHSHGGSTVQAFRITCGISQNVDGIDTCRSYTYQNNKQWWKLGDRNLRYLHFTSCHSLELTDLDHWDGVAKGLHIITGGDGLMYSISDRGSSFAFWANFPIFRQTLKSAWFIAGTDDETVVILAYGTSRDNAINRRDNEKYGWPLENVNHTWRAWSWYSID